MSFELEVRSDDEYSRLAPRDRVEAVLTKQWAVNARSRDLLVYAQEGCYVEITAGDRESPEPSSDLVAWVGFRVPAGARLKSSARSLEIAMALATELGWRVFDPQRDDYVPPSELEPGPSLREALGRLATEVRGAGTRRFLGMAVRRLSRQSATGVLFPLILGFGIAVAVGWLFRFSIETRPWLFMSLTLSAAIGLIALDVLSDVLGEIHQDALRRARNGGAA